MDRPSGTIIESIGTYIPSGSLSTAEVLQGCKHALRFPLEKITGIASRPVVGPREYSIDLARRAVEDCLARSAYAPSDIDLLLCCNISRWDGPGRVSFEPSTSIRLRQAYGFDAALAFDLTNACAGMFTGIFVVDAFLKAGAIRRGMVVSGEYITHLMRAAQREIEGFMDDRMACLTLGDAGAALILERGQTDETGFRAIDLQTLGRYSQYCISKSSQAGDMIMHTDSVRLTEAAIKHGAWLARRVLQSAGWDSYDFDHLIMHQTSRMSLNSAVREINRQLDGQICHEGNTLNNLEQRGNTASTSHFIALADAMQDGRINAGDRIVFNISASGLTIGDALYVMDDLPDRYRRGSLPADSKKDPETRRAGSAILFPGKSRLRIESVAVLPKDQPPGSSNTLALAVKVAREALERSSYDLADIELLLYCGVYRSDYLLEPAYATLLAGELDMNAVAPGEDSPRTLAFDIFNGALGYMNACSVARAMIGAGRIRTAMVVAAEIENNARTFPDALLGLAETASATILDGLSSDGQGLSPVLFRYAEDLQPAYTTFRTLRDGKPFMHAEKDPRLEDMYLATLSPAIEELLQREGLGPEEVDLVFPPQLSSGFIRRLAQSLSLPRARFVDAVGQGPDLNSSSIPHAISWARAQGLIRSEDLGLFISVGSGIQVGCAIYRF